MVIGRWYFRIGWSPGMQHWYMNGARLRSPPVLSHIGSDGSLHWGKGVVVTIGPWCLWLVHTLFVEQPFLSGSAR
jgi:hypothetical protein